MVQYDDNILMIRHFPNDLTLKEKVEFMKYFGALDVKSIDSKRKNHCLIFARFENHDLAEEVIKRLHQVEFLGQRLSVEFARSRQITQDIPIEESGGAEGDKDTGQLAEQKQLESFLERLTSWTSGLKLKQPPPVHLKYLYPPPSTRVLANIAKALAQVPKFYTQVLHLMNRMNLPCPFVEDYPVCSNLIAEDFGVERTEVPAHQEEVGDSDESEIETEEGLQCSEVIPAKRARTSAALKRPKFVKPAAHKQPTSKPVQPHQVFETTKEIATRKVIELKVKADLPSIQDTSPVVVEAGGFEKIEPPRKEGERGEKQEGERGEKQEGERGEKQEGEAETDDEVQEAVITSEELDANRISSRDQHLLPVFKKYQAGVPSCRLYIKNLAKTVVAKDLHFIYRRYYIDHQDEQGTMFDIRLMQEGRMKGQAFITLQTVGQAQLALNETNGYILKDKPMVVQFARSAKASS